MNIDNAHLVFLLGFIMECSAPATVEAAKRIGLDIEEAGGWDYQIHSIGVFRGADEDHMHLNVIIQFTLNDDISGGIRNFAREFKELLTCKRYPNGEMVYIQTLSPEEVESMKPDQQDSRVVH
jgi:hypothetical protein